MLFGLTTQLEIELAELVRRFYPAAERLRFVSTGTEATWPRSGSRARRPAGTRS